MRSRLHRSVQLAVLAITLFAAAAPSVAIPAATAVPARSSVMSTERTSLRRALSAFLDHRMGRATVGVSDLFTGQRIFLRPRHPQRTASIVKVEILEALLARHHAPLRPPRLGQARRMIKHSSNADAEALYEAIGGANALRAFGRRAGLRATLPASAWGLTLTTPADQLRILHLLLTPNTILTDRDRAFVLGLMRHVEADQRWGITAGTSKRAIVAIKDGWLWLRRSDWQINSIGYVRAPHHDYLIAVIDTANPTMAYGVRTVERISRIVWSHTGHRRTSK